MKTKTPMKQYLCVEHGEEFLVEARDAQHAREQAAMWGGEFIREYKPRKANKVETITAPALSDTTKLDKLKKRHVEVIKKMLLDFTRVPSGSRVPKGKVLLALDEDLWEKHRDLHWKIFQGRGE